MSTPDSITSAGQIDWQRKKAASSPPALTYTWTDMFIEQPGLGHMKEIVRTLLMEAESCGRVALLPALRSNPLHFPGPRRGLRWSDYFDWSEFPISDPRTASRRDLSRLVRQVSSLRLLSHQDAQVPATDPVELVVRHFPDSNIFNHTTQLSQTRTTRYEEPGFSERFPAAVRTAASAVADELHPLAGVLHLRRGDLAGPSTSIESVRAHLLSRDVKSSDRVFVMTNERDPAYLRDLRSHFPGIVYEHECLSIQRALNASASDNYLAFRIGKCLQKHHDRKGLGTLRFMAEHILAPPSRNWTVLRVQLLRKLCSVTPEWLARCRPQI